MVKVKSFLIGVFLLATLLAATEALPCDGGGGGDIFNGNFIVKDFKLTNGTTTVDFDGVINVDAPYINPNLTLGVDTVFIKSAALETNLLNYVRNIKYIDLSSADVQPMTAPEPPVCDEIYGYVLIIDEAKILPCSYLVECP